MKSVTIDEAKAMLAELIDRLRADDEVIITRNDRPVARLLPTIVSLKRTRQPGTLQGSVTYMALDFDAPLDEFKEHMP